MRGGVSLLKFAFVAQNGPHMVPYPNVTDSVWVG